MIGLNPGFDPALLSQVEDAGLNASAPPQQRWLDGWLLRFSPGKAKRARCVNAVAEGRQSVHDKWRQCETLFEEAKLPLIFRITPFTAPTSLDATFEATGLRRFDDTRVMVLADLDRHPRLVAPCVLPTNLKLNSLSLDAFAQRVGALRGSPLAQQQAHAERLVNAPVPFRACELRMDGEVAACGQLALEGNLVGLYDVFTAPEARGQGLAQILCERLLSMGISAGARHAYLQVEGDNLAARSVYHRLGFADGYGYHYRTADPSAA